MSYRLNLDIFINRLESGNEEILRWQKSSQLFRLDAGLWFTKILSADSCFLIYRLINVNGRMVKTLSGQEYGL